MYKTKRVTMNVNNLTVDTSLNGRDVDNYDLDAMDEMIRSRHRIEQDIHAFKRVRDGKEEVVVIKGNRRTLSGQRLYNQPDITAELKENLGKVGVLLYEGLDADGKDLMGLIYDQGESKGLNKTEIVLACWKMAKQGFTESEIALTLYYNLAAYSGTLAKLSELPVVPPGATAVQANQIRDKRAVALKSWFHGTLGNYILTALRLSDEVKEQFIIGHRVDDKLPLPEGKTLTVKLNRKRISQLNTAKGADQKAHQADPTYPEWTVEKGGPEYNKVLEQFKAEDRGDVAKPSTSVPTPKTLKQMGENMSDPAMRAVFFYACGEGSGAELPKLDDANTRNRRAVELAAKHGGRVNGDLGKILRSLASDSPEQIDKLLATIPNSK